MQFIQIFKQGGFIMWPLLMFSVAIWVITIHKILYLMKFNKDAKHYVTEATRIVQSQKLHEMEHLYKTCPEVIAKAHFAIFDEALSREDYEQRLHRRLDETNSDLKKNMWMLGTIASSAPFVGLFGTVWGIMESFKQIGSSGKAGFSVVAGSISEALIATGSGIAVAVIAVMFYNYLNVKVAATGKEFKNSLGDMADVFNAMKK
ncbi:MAG: MotA/TolQ/ExbB proton channel family protein [Bdellovibrionales bacterium]|nr:MotA/TolQ/ExbB proton channel family protein [Bdellovibrionales bacterium]